MYALKARSRFLAFPFFVLHSPGACLPESLTEMPLPGLLAAGAGLPGPQEEGVWQTGQPEGFVGKRVRKDLAQLPGG